MSDDDSDSQLYSAANLTRIGSASDDEYGEDGWDVQRLQEPPVPPLPQPLDQRPLRLHANTRRATAMAGGQIIPPCSSPRCRGCTPSCQQDHPDHPDLWCEFCKLGRWDLCGRRDRCIGWTDVQFREFQDLQLIARSGALQEIPPAAPMAASAPATMAPTIPAPGSTPTSKPAESAIDSTQSETEGAKGGSSPVVTGNRQEREQTPTSSSSDTPVTPASTRPSVTSKEETPPASSVASVRPKVLVDKTKSPGSGAAALSGFKTLGASGSSFPPIPYYSIRGVPVGGGTVMRINDDVPRDPLTRTRGYGSAAISPFQGPPSDLEEMMVVAHPSPSDWRVANSPVPWDGGGLPEQSVNTGAREELWRRTRNIDMDDTNESFSSPLTQTPLTEGPETACRGKGLLGAQGPARSILKPPSFIPPVRSTNMEGHYPPVHHQDQYNLVHDPPDRQVKTDHQTRVTWSASTPLRRPSSVDQGRRRIPVDEEEEEASFQFVTEREAEEEGGLEDEGGGMESLQGNQVRVARVLEMLTQQLMENKQSKPNPTPAVKLPQMTLPTPARKSATGEVTAKAFYLWKASLAHSLRNHALDPNAILLLYSTNDKLLPLDWQSIFSSSATLKEAICGLDMLFPPLASVHPEIIKSMTGLPVLTSPTEKTKVFRISTLLRSLEQLLKLFGQDQSKDLSRQETMVIIYGLSSTSESRAELVTVISDMDRARRQGILYAQSLRDYLVRTRMILTDVIAAVQLVGRQEPEGKAKSAAARLRMKEKGEDGKEKEEKKEGKKTFTCLLCSKAHPTFSCSEQLALLRAGKRSLPATICKICLQANDDNHPKICGERRFLKDGIYQKINFRCPKGCGVNHKLCACKAGATIVVDKDQTPPPKKVGSAATRVVEVPQTNETEQGNLEESEAEEINEVSSAANRSKQEDQDGAIIFQVENVLLQGRDSSTQLVAASFDTHGSSHFISGELADNFNWAKEEEDRSFEIDTIHGKAFTKHQVLEVKLLTLSGAVMLEAIKGSWIDPKEEDTLDPETASKFGIATPELEDCEGRALPRLIIGCSKLSSLHPKSIPAPPGFNDLHPNLACFRSRISRAVLCAGATGAGLGNRF